MTKFKGGGDHFGNFIDAVKARDPKLLHRRHPRRPSLLRPQPPGQHLLLPRQAGLGEPRSSTPLAAWKTHEDVADCLERTLKHLAANGVDVAKTPMSLGPAAEDRLGRRDDPRTIRPPAAMLTREYRAPFIVPKAEQGVERHGERAAGVRAAFDLHVAAVEQGQLLDDRKPQPAAENVAASFRCGSARIRRRAA